MLATERCFSGRLRDPACVPQLWALASVKEYTPRKSGKEKSKQSARGKYSITVVFDSFDSLHRSRSAKFQLCHHGLMLLLWKQPPFWPSRDNGSWTYTFREDAFCGASWSPSCVSGTLCDEGTKQRTDEAVVGLLVEGLGQQIACGKLVCVAVWTKRNLFSLGKKIMLDQYQEYPFSAY